MRLAILVLLTGLTLAAPISAQQTPPTATTAAEALPSVSLPPELDRVLRDYERAWRGNDIPALVALFTDDGFVLQPGKAPASQQEKPQPQQQPKVQMPPKAPSGANKAKMQQSANAPAHKQKPVTADHPELRKLHSLREAGILTEQEFLAARDRLLAKI